MINTILNTRNEIAARVPETHPHVRPASLYLDLYIHLIISHYLEHCLFPLITRLTFPDTEIGWKRECEDCWSLVWSCPAQGDSRPVLSSSSLWWTVVIQMLAPSQTVTEHNVVNGKRRIYFHCDDQITLRKTHILSFRSEIKPVDFNIEDLL